MSFSENFQCPFFLFLLCVFLVVLVFVSTLLIEFNESNKIGKMCIFAVQLRNSARA